jgi:hypothetical protein
MTHHTGPPNSDVSSSHPSVRVLETAGAVRVQITVPRTGVPGGLPRRVVDEVFLLPELAKADLVEVTLPLGERDALEALREHLADMRSHAAGSTCLVEGRLAEPAR